MEVSLVCNILHALGAIELESPTTTRLTWFLCMYVCMYVYVYVYVYIMF